MQGDPGGYCTDCTVRRHSEDLRLEYLCTCRDRCRRCRWLLIPPAHICRLGREASTSIEHDDEEEGLVVGPCWNIIITVL